MSKILVPLDGSVFSEQSLPYACQIARRMGATIELVHVHRIPIVWTRENSQTVVAHLDEEVREAEMEVA